jgi:uncharacterized protein (TIGR02284 family)
MAVPTQIVNALNNLIETCKDGEKGFQTAAQGVRDLQLKQLFETYVRQRAEFARELQEAIRQLGAEPETSGSAAGALHRGWMNIKSAVTGTSDSAVVEEAERGEDSAKAAYEEALSAPLPGNIRPIVERQYAAVKQAHDQVRALRRAA